MSDTVHYKGKLFIIGKEKGETIDQQCKRICKYHGFTDMGKYNNSWEELVLDKLYDEYYVDDESIYKIKKEEISTEDEVFESTVIDNKSVSFEIKYYSGGCGLHEALGFALENQKS